MLRVSLKSFSTTIRERLGLSMKKIYVIYHAPCYDGFGAAWAAWVRLGNKAEYIPMSYSTVIEPDRFEKGSTIYFVDFSSKPDVMATLGDGRTVIVLDHHKTAEANLKDFPILSELSNASTLDLESSGVSVRFDMDKSGAMLSWEYFNPYQEIPELIKYVQDRDLWQFKLKGSKEFSAYLQTVEYNFQAWHELNEFIYGGSLNEIIERGELCLKQIEQTVKLITKKSMVSEYKGVKIAYCNSSSHWSEVGHKLLEMFPQADMALSFCLLPQHSSFMGSCRSDVFDVSKWAQENFNGGGHPKAAGFNLAWDDGLVLLEDLDMGRIPNKV